MLLPSFSLVTDKCKMLYQSGTDYGFAIRFPRLLALHSYVKDLSDCVLGENVNLFPVRSIK